MRSTALALIVALLAFGASDALAQQSEATAWRQVAEAIPLGSRVKVQMTNGKRVNGTLMRVDGDAVMVKKNTRQPEPAVVVPFDQVSKLEREQKGDGMNFGKAIAISVATGAGLVLSMILFAMQFD
jgi:small nuclear ribonucleoprotein (snRNP)-like protein